MEKLKSIKETLTSVVEGQLGHLDNVNAEELGEVVDMIKDMSEAIYYCTVVKEMEECKKEEELMDKIRSKMPTPHMKEEEIPYRNYTPAMMPWPWDGMPPYEDYNRYYGTAVTDRGSNNGNRGGASGNPGGRSSDSYTYANNGTGRDSREGRSPDYRRTYMESKELHKDKSTKMKELEKYMQELSHDLLEMIEDASVEEKQLLQSKISTLASKIN